MVHGERPIDLVCGIVTIQILWAMVYGPWSMVYPLHAKKIARVDTPALLLIRTL